MRYLVIAILITLPYLHLGVAQGAAHIQVESLRYLPGVAVVIEDVEAEAKAEGLSEEAIRTTVERILQSSGIRLLTPVERSNTPSQPSLYVRVSTYKIEPGPYSFAVTVALKQLVALAHRPQRTMFASTWEQGMTGTAGSQNIGQATSAVEDLVKRFAIDFLAANAGEAVREEK
jgi:hypothetical protein